MRAVLLPATVASRAEHLERKSASVSAGFHPLEKLRA